TSSVPGASAWSSRKMRTDWYFSIKEVAYRVLNRLLDQGNKNMGTAIHTHYPLEGLFLNRKRKIERKK
ncbi:MAG TPA: hypothetical protein VFQ30_16725, partial [Ktedonobacteraceae bacterium]|nr:hypothetical protein [Ktedonobacteraceae bacterium]